ncbi:MAG: zeta toxin family protein [Thermodesulfobacteriota bacterium]|nr:zeta toxin family protein [Thermodesulfobacteriota bacterium]
MSYERKVVIIAGPNGAGKTTFALEFLPNEADCPVFVNADLIAAGLAPFQPEKSAIRAGRLMLEEIKAHVLKSVSFAFETTLSGRGYARMIPEWREKGYRIKLIFLMLPNVEIAIERVATRVAQGGHAVPETVIRRRFIAGSRNFNEIYKRLADVWTLYDNSREVPVMLENGGRE